MTTLVEVEAPEGGWRAAPPEDAAERATIVWHLRMRGEGKEGAASLLGALDVAPGTGSGRSRVRRLGMMSADCDFLRGAFGAWVEGDGRRQGNVGTPGLAGDRGERGEGLEDDSEKVLFRAIFEWGARKDFLGGW